MNTSFRTIIVLCAAVLLCASCSDDSPVEPEPEPESNNPPIPVPSHPGDVLPGRSDSLVISTSLLSTFTPFHDAAPDTLSRRFPNKWIYLHPEDQRPHLVHQGIVIDPAGLTIKLCDLPDCAPFGTGLITYQTFPGLPSSPHIQYLRFWKKLFSTKIEHPSTYTETHTWTEGTSETHGETMAYSIGVEAEIWEIGLSAEFSQTFSHDITISSEYTVEKEFSASSIDGKTIVFTVWELLEGFRIVNADGTSPYDDGEFHILLPVVENGTSEIYQSVVHFDN